MTHAPNPSIPAGELPTATEGLAEAMAAVLRMARENGVTTRIVFVGLPQVASMAGQAGHGRKWLHRIIAWPSFSRRNKVEAIRALEAGRRAMSLLTDPCQLQPPQHTA